MVVFERSKLWLPKPIIVCFGQNNKKQFVPAAVAQASLQMQ